MKSQEREAEELRSGIEKLAEGAELIRDMVAEHAHCDAVLVSDLLDLLDRVDARDSLSFLEKRDRRKKSRAKRKAGR